MENFFRKLTPTKRKKSSSSTPAVDDTSVPIPPHAFMMPINVTDMNDLPWDPSDRPRILNYHPNQRDEIRRHYWLRGASQPYAHNFPKTTIGNKPRRFISKWFDQYGNWLEYSIKTDRAFCLCCYLFRENVSQQAGNDAFVTEGFKGWNKTERLSSHVGGVNSYHNRALKKCADLMRENQSISSALHKQSGRSGSLKNDYRIRLNASIGTCRFLLNGALPFRGHDESETSLNKGHFLELLKYVRKFCDIVRNVTLENAPGNHKMTCPEVQKDIALCFSQEILKAIFEEISNDVFGLLVDESGDVSRKEQMAMVLRYVDSRGYIKERFVDVVHVTDTSSKSLKSSINSLFSQHGLGLNQVRGQGYDGASNMRGEFNGFKALILKENSSAFYVHCFANQLQLVIVAVARNHDGVANIFEIIGLLTNVVCASCKRKDMLREGYKKRVEEEIGNNEIETGTGLNQDLSLTRAGDTRWGSHYKTLSSLVSLYPEVLDVLEYVRKDGDSAKMRGQEFGIKLYFESFEFVFYLHLMLHILGLTGTLSQALQKKKDQDILEVVSLVRITTKKLQKCRDDGFKDLLEQVYDFCEKHEIVKLEMAENYIHPMNRRARTDINNRRYFQIGIFNMVLDMQLVEFRDRFNEVNTELLANMAALSPCNPFSSFNISKLVNLSKSYPCDFTEMERRSLEKQLGLYIDVVQEDGRFSNLNGIADLAKVMVETRRQNSYRLVYRLLKLALVLPVATVTVERCFSAMKIVKSDLRNRIGDGFLNATLICDIEKEELAKVTNEFVMDRFQKMKNRRGLL